jgi:hypothetical protein
MASAIFTAASEFVLAGADVDMLHPRQRSCQAKPAVMPDGVENSLGDGVSLSINLFGRFLS